jgi:hypothetical protein
MAGAGRPHPRRLVPWTVIEAPFESAVAAAGLTGVLPASGHSAGHSITTLPGWEQRAFGVLLAVSAVSILGGLYIAGWARRPEALLAGRKLEQFGLLCLGGAGLVVGTVLAQGGGIATSAFLLAIATASFGRAARIAYMYRVLPHGGDQTDQKERGP